MEGYTGTELEDSAKALRSSIGKCEKVLARLKDGCWQKEWTQRQLEAFYICVNLIECMPSEYTKEQFSQAAKTIGELIEKTEKMLERLKEGSAQKTLARRRHKAFLIALSLIKNKE